MLIKPLLILLYPLLLLSRAVDAIRGRDRLRLKEPADASLWVSRREVPDALSHFSQAATRFNEDGSSDRIITRLLIAAARLYAPPHQLADPVYKAAADREQGIPDEVYTLW